MSIDLRFSDVDPPDPDPIRTIYCDIAGLPNPMYLGLIPRVFNDDTVTLYMQLEGSHPNWTFTPTNLGSLGAGSNKYYRINQFGYRTRPSSETNEILDITLNAYTDAGYSNLKWTITRSITTFMLRSDDGSWSLDENDDFIDGTIQGWAASSLNPPVTLAVVSDFVLSPIYSLKASEGGDFWSHALWLYKSFTTEEKDLVFAIANLRFDENLGGLPPSFTFRVQIDDETIIYLPTVTLDKWYSFLFPLPRGSTIQIKFYYTGSSSMKPWSIIEWLDDFKIISKDRDELPPIDLSDSEGIAFYWWGSGGSDQNIDIEMWSPTGGWVGKFPDGPARWRWVFLRWSDFTVVDLDGSLPDPSDIREINWTYHTDGVRRVNYIVGWRKQDLYGHAVIRNISSDELYAHVVIQDTAELYGHAIIRNVASVNLPATFEVGQGSADLLCKFKVAQDSAELLGKVKITRSDSVELFSKCNIVTPIQFSLREHKVYAGWNPNWSYSKQTASILRATSSWGALGRSYFFINVSREWLHGKYIRIRWAADYSNISWGTQVYIYDGAYNRASDVDFPSGSGLLPKGNGLLQAGLIHTGDFSMRTEEFQVDVSGGSEDMVMIAIQSNDSWNSADGYYQVETLEINSGPAGAGALRREKFDAAIVMERTGTTGDYGRISEGELPQAASRELYASFTVNP